MDWVYPSTLLPLGDFILATRARMEYCAPLDAGVENYLSVMLDAQIIPRSSKSYVPFARLPRDDVRRGETVLHGLYPPDGDWVCYGGRSTYMLLIDELTANIYDHSEFDNAMVMAQRYDKKEFVELCIFDNGITIKGSFEKHLNAKWTGLQSIEEAISGTSTKSNKERGTGLQNTIRLVTEGMQGQIMIVSGDGLVYHNFSDTLGYNLITEANKLNGTLISVRFPIQLKEVPWHEIIK
ncbi:MAG: hypothetical protein ABH950_07845 [Candidatus Altiarchaeota archaeon]